MSIGERVSLANEALSKNQIYGFFSFTRCADDESFVISHHLDPSLNIGGAVLEAAGSFQPCRIDKCCCADLCNQFFLALFFVCEVSDCRQAIQATGMTSAVRQFMKGGAAILGGFRKLFHTGENYAVCAGLIIGAVTALVNELDAALPDVC